MNSDDVCSVCRSSDQVWAEWEKQKAKRIDSLTKKIDKARRKQRPYDALIPLSGGKDSTYVLYLCRKELDLRCLAVTWDNGFLSDHARENIRRAVGRLNVDHLYYGLNQRDLMSLYRHFFLKTGFFCPVCMRGISATAEAAARAFRIPLVIAGTSLRTEEYVAPEFFLDGNPAFFRQVIAGESVEERAFVLMYGERLFQAAARALKRTFINLPDYVEWDYETIFRTISTELGWTAHRVDAEHADCRVENIVNHIRLVKFPALVPEMLRYSKLVSIGQMTREEAQLRVRKAEGDVAEPENLGWFLDTLSIDRRQMNEVLADPLRHMQYLKGETLVRRLLRTVRRVLVDPILDRA